MNNTTILEPLEKEKVTWDVKLIDFDILNQETQESEKNYKAGNMDKFQTLDFWLEDESI